MVARLKLDEVDGVAERVKHAGVRQLIPGGPPCEAWGCWLKNLGQGLQVDASITPFRWLLTFEPEEGVAQRKDLPLANAPFLVPELVAHWTLLTASVNPATFRNHLHALHPGETPLEGLVEGRVVPPHDDEHLGIRKRRRRQRFEELLAMTETDPVC